MVFKSKFYPVLYTKYNNWTVISEETKRNKYGITEFYVKCKCNLKKWVNASDLINNNSKQCISCSQFDGIEDLSNSYIGSVKKGAKLRNINFEVDIKYLYELLINQNFKCALSGLQLTLSKKYYGKFRHLQNASLDRIDSSQGYLIGNVQWVHKDVNIMKNKFKQEYFIDICNLIYKNCEVK